MLSTIADWMVVDSRRKSFRRRVPACRDPVALGCVVWAGAFLQEYSVAWLIRAVGQLVGLVSVAFGVSVRCAIRRIRDLYRRCAQTILLDRAEMRTL